MCQAPVWPTSLPDSLLSLLWLLSSSVIVPRENFTGITGRLCRWHIYRILAWIACIVCCDWPLGLRNRMTGADMPLLPSWRTRETVYCSSVERLSMALGSWGRTKLLHVIKASLSSTGSRADIRGVIGTDISPLCCVGSWCSNMR